MSNHLHDVQPGDTIWVQPPTGDFTVKHPENELVLIAGGVGITPLLSMLLHRVETQDDVSSLVFVHCCKDPEHHIMADELRQLSAQHSFKYYVSYETGSGADHQGYLDPTVLSRWLKKPDADVYFCGPKPFMTAVNTALQNLGFEDKQLHYEVFGPSTRLPTH